MTDITVDVELLRSEIEKTYTEVSTDHDKEFIFPTGRWWAQELGYPEPELGRVPDATVASFAGVANHWELGAVEPGSVVLDLGCGAGTDLLIAAQAVTLGYTIVTDNEAEFARVDELQRENWLRRS